MRHKYVLELKQDATPFDADGDTMDSVPGEISTETVGSLLTINISNQVEAQLNPVEAITLANILLSFAVPKISNP